MNDYYCIICGVKLYFNVAGSMCSSCVYNYYYDEALKTYPFSKEINESSYIDKLDFIDKLENKTAKVSKKKKIKESKPIEVVTIIIPPSKKRRIIFED